LGLLTAGLGSAVAGLRVTGLRACAVGFGVDLGFTLGFGFGFGISDSAVTSLASIYRGASRGLTLTSDWLLKFSVSTYSSRTCSSSVMISGRQMMAP
jgi:hypothetical protein